MKYEEFIASKISNVNQSGFEVPDKLNPFLFDYQDYIVRIALKKGKYAIFAECGLGKTIMQLEWAHRVSVHTNRPVLIICPLAVSGQTILEGEKFGIEVSRCEHTFMPGKVYIINYEQIHNIDCDEFAGVVLDESSILKNFAGKTKEMLLQKFMHTPYKLCCTATPSPNDETEICNHAEFLNIASRLEVLSKYFIHDSGETSVWRLKHHATIPFYAWMKTWATMIGTPSDLGYDGDMYVLSQLKYIEHQITTDKRDNGQLFNDTSVSASTFGRELRDTLDERIKKASEIVNGDNDQWIVWCNLNIESSLISKTIHGSVEVTGSMSAEDKEAKLLGFANGDFRVLVTKKEIAQFGLNFQNCHKQMFVSLDFSFEGLYQAVRRSYRFGQKHDVEIHIVTTDTMQNVIETINVKTKKFQTMQQYMNSAINATDIQGYEQSDIHSICGENYKIMRGDCVQRIRELSDGESDFVIFSPPFAELYVYSDSPHDMGNVRDYDEFASQFKYLLPEISRVLKPGRLCAVHCMDLPLQKWKDGVIGFRDFSGMLIKLFQDSGFVYHDRITIWKNPVVEMQRTKALGLLHKQIKKDATRCRTGNPDYLLVFRNSGENSIPVKLDISVDLWQKWASPVWMDIEQGDVLNKIKGSNDEKHICPLQLHVIERAVLLWTNPGETVMTPFAGIGSEMYESIRLRRKAIGIELKREYFDIAVHNCNTIESTFNQLALNV